jgi:hypothetical protein
MTREAKKEAETLSSPSETQNVGKHFGFFFLACGEASVAQTSVTSDCWIRQKGCCPKAQQPGEKNLLGVSFLFSLL